MEIMGTVQYCGFKINREEYAIPVMDVQEVIKPQRVTPVPLAQQTIRGLINLRGQIVTCISPRKLFGQDDNLESDYMNIIVRGEDSLFSLVVDEVTDIVNIDTSELESTPETISSRLKKYVSHIYKKDEGLIVLLNITKILELNSSLPEEVGHAKRGSDESTSC